MEWNFIINVVRELAAVFTRKYSDPFFDPYVVLKCLNSVSTMFSFGFGYSRRTLKSEETSGGRRSGQTFGLALSTISIDLNGTIFFVRASH